MTKKKFEDEEEEAEKTLEKLKWYGFDKSSREGTSVDISCSQCEVLVINGVPCHERGCPNMSRN